MIEINGGMYPVPDEEQWKKIIEDIFTREGYRDFR